MMTASMVPVTDPSPVQPDPQGGRLSPQMTFTEDVEPRSVVDVARPVSLNLEDGHHEQVRRWVEGVLGWQVVDEQISALVPPTAHLLGPTAPVPRDTTPRILIVADTTPAELILEACHRLRPHASLVWPGQHDQLESIVARCTRQVVGTDPGLRRLRIGGVAGGVGTTTVSLAVAGLAAWRGSRTLAVVRGDVPAKPAMLLTAEAVTAPDLWSRLEDVPGVPDLRVVQMPVSAAAASPTDPAIDLAVADQGVDLDCDVAVCRPDAAARERLSSTTAAVVVVVGTGPLRPTELREAAGGRAVLDLPWSFRVARAGLHRRVPVSMPGAWLQRLRTLLSSTDRERTSRSRRAAQDDPTLTLEPARSGPLVMGEAR